MATSRSLVIASALALLALAFAGCIATPRPGAEVDPASDAETGAFEPFSVPKPDFDFSKLVDPDHGPGHAVATIHAGSHGLSLVGHTGVGGILPPGVRGSITQIDVQGNWTVVSGMEGGLAFVILDTSDPKMPKPVSWVPSAADGWTARFSDDAQYVFYGCQMILPTAAVLGDCRDATAPHAPNTPPSGVAVYDVKDKSKPKLVDFLPTAGSHNIQVAMIDGVDYVFTSAVTILKFDRAAGKLEEIAKVPGRHDASVAKHPITGDWILYTGTKELAIYKVNDPAIPELLHQGVVGDIVGWHEQTPIPGLIDGRAVLAVGGEQYLDVQGFADRVGLIDVTDPSNPVALGTWAPPFAPKLPWASYMYSIHEMAATPQGQLAVSWYHAGAWVLDISNETRLKEPVTVAAYMPSKPANVVPSTFFQTPAPMVPFVWSAAWDARGYLLIPDMHTGVYVLEPTWGLRAVVDGGA